MPRFFQPRTLRPSESDGPDWLTQGRTRRKEVIDYYGDRWEAMTLNYNFYGGKIFSKEQKDRAAKNLKHLLEFNNYPTIINTGTSREAVNRYRPALKGREVGKKDKKVAQFLFQTFGIEDVLDDPSTAAAMTEAIRWIEQMCDAGSEISEAFLDTWLCGVGWTNTWLDPMDGIDGKIKTTEVSPWDVGADIDSKKRNFADMMYVWAWKFVLLEEAMVMFPNKADDVLAASVENTRFHIPEKGRSKHDRPHYRSSDAGFYSPHTNQVELGNYQFKTREDRFVFDDPETGEETNLGIKEFRRARRGWKTLGIPDPEFDRLPQWAHRQVWFAGDQPLSDEPEDTPIPGFTYSAITCYPHKSPRGTIWFGPGDLGRDPEMWASKFLSSALDQWGSSPKAQIILGQNSMTAGQKEEFRQEVTRPDGMPTVQDPDQVKFGPPPQYPTGMLPLIEYATGGVWDSMGMNKLSAGQLDDPRRAAFATVNALMQAGQGVYAMPFDSLSFHRRGLAKKYLWFILEFVDPIILLRALGHEHVQAIADLMVQDEGGVWMWDPVKYQAMMLFDVVSDEAPVTPNSGVALLQALSDQGMFALLQQSGMAPPMSVIVEALRASGIISGTQAQDWLQNPTGAPPEMQQAVLEQVIAQLPPELQEAVVAALQAGEQEASAESGEVPS